MRLRLDLTFAMACWVPGRGGIGPGGARAAPSGNPCRKPSKVPLPGGHDLFAPLIRWKRGSHLALRSQNDEAREVVCKEGS